MSTKMTKSAEESSGIEDKTSATKSETKAASVPKDAVPHGKGGQYRSVGGGMKVPVSGNSD